ncbi:methyltransferase family protein [Pseudomonas sp. GV071]|nr:methyltransferase family protein [Pseudomonas sp. GV071]
MAKALAKYFNHKISIFDKFVRSTDQNSGYVEEPNLKHYDLVINSAMFEHVTHRDSLNEVNNLVSNNGVLMIHTVVCETVPNDPNWFYITPMVHTAFHTNKSMEILMDQWGYSKSVYSPQAKSWFLFKDSHPQIKNLHKKIDAINNELQTKYFISKDGFVDYWKGFDLI